jgi:formylglycine-generating enzyme required for sulfatase activity
MKTKLRPLFVVLAFFACVHPVPAQLGIAPAGDQTVLFWPATLTNYVLQSSTNLASPNWVTVSNTVPMTAVGVTNTSPAMFFRLSQPTAGMALIPAGPFTIGDTLDGESDAIPASVTVSAFYMDTNLVSFSQWLAVCNWATNCGYGFDNTATGKAANHPAQTVTWYDAVKWCNARSQLAGLAPVYYTDAGLTEVYTNGDTDAVYPNWAANGYRLPTEAEYEKAARGGLSGQRFPWGDTISESQDNYYGDPNGALISLDATIDLGPSGYNANFDTGGFPYTSPVGYFAPNGYGLCDMAGNVVAWCWDWYAGPPYPAGSPYLGGTDPHGPASGSSRILRGGNWGTPGEGNKCAQRIGEPGAPSDYYIGFRCVKAL